MQRVAILGAGWMAGVHGDAYSNMENAEVAAIVDVNADAAKELATRLDAEAFTDFHDMIEAVNPDIIDICTPTMFHKEYVIRSAAAGKHVVLEKPMARTMADCREMIEAVERAGITCMVAQVIRFFPEFIAAKEQVDAGAVGKPAVIRTTRGGGFPGKWYTNYEESGGAIFDTLVHDFDWLLWTFGPIERVFAKGLGPRMAELKLDYALVTLRFASGAIAHVEGNWAHTINGFTAGVEIAGDNGLISFTNHEEATLRTKIADGDSPAVWESPTMNDPYFLELQHFVDCVETGKKPSVGLVESMRAVEVALAAIESIRTGKPVDLPLGEEG